MTPDIVLDASAFIASEVQGSEPARVFVGDAERIVIPPIFELEVVNAMRRLERQGVVSAGQLTGLAEDLEREVFVRVPTDHLLGRIVGMRHRLSPYDASYVVLAAELGLPLVTADVRLARGAEHLCTVELL